VDESASVLFSISSEPDSENSKSLSTVAHFFGVGTFIATAKYVVSIEYKYSGKRNQRKKERKNQPASREAADGFVAGEAARCFLVGAIVGVVFVAGFGIFFGWGSASVGIRSSVGGKKVGKKAAAIQNTAVTAAAAETILCAAIDLGGSFALARI
jgi:opacity protein-like surface antigen